MNAIMKIHKPHPIYFYVSCHYELVSYFYFRLRNAVGNIEIILNGMINKKINESISMQKVHTYKTAIYSLKDFKLLHKVTDLRWYL